MTDHDALLRAIIDHPDEDTPLRGVRRLAGRTRADRPTEFIRLQCRLSDGDSSPPTDSICSTANGNCSRFTASAGSPPPSCWPSTSAAARFSAAFSLASACRPPPYWSTGRSGFRRTPSKRCASPTAAGCWARSSGSRGWGKSPALTCPTTTSHRRNSGAAHFPAPRPTLGGSRCEASL